MDRPLSTLAVGAGRLGLMRAPAQPGDLARIDAFAPALVLSLTESAEMAELGLATLGADLAARGIAHAHLPIPDFGIPPAATMATWQALAPRLHGLIDAGAGVLIHCRAGLGRSGTMAALFLIERGTAPEAAIAAVRQARPGAIETAAQERWLHAQRPRGA